MSDDCALLQVCPNDHPPFADICRCYEAAAAALGWRVATVMLEGRVGEHQPGFHYADGNFARCAGGALGGREPTLALCHRYRAYRTVMSADLHAGRVVVVAHEFGFFRRRRRRWQRRLDRLRGRGHVTFAGVSAAVTEELRAVTGDAVLLPNGIDLARADAARVGRESARARLGLRPSAFGIGVVGRLHPKKNPLLAVDGFVAAAARMPAAELVFVGDGELAGAVAERGAGAPVTLAGFVPDAPHLMSAFDLLLIPSGEREAFGMVALEAMAAGVPVLCGPAPGPRYVVGETGFLFDADEVDSLAGALLSAHRAWLTGTLADRAREARRRVEREFSVQAAAGRLDALAITG